MRSLLSTLSFVAVCASAVACGPAMDEKSGDDAKRGGATEIKVDAPFDDRVSAWQGDNTDWKTFELAQRARVLVKVWWDNPEIEATVVVRGMSAKPAKLLKHTRGTRSETIGPVDLDEGKWFIQVRASDGASVYTMEVSTGRAPKGKGGGGDLPDF